MWEMAGFFPALSHPSLKLFFRLAQAQFPDSRFHKRTAFIKFLSVWGLDARIQQGAGDRERAIITRALPQLRWQQNPAVFSGEVSGEQTEREREKEPSLGMSVRIPVPPAPPQRVIMDSETGLHWNKA